MASFSVGLGAAARRFTTGLEAGVWLVSALGAAARRFTTGLEAGVWLVSVFGWVPRQDGLRPD